VGECRGPTSGVYEIGYAAKPGVVAGICEAVSEQLMSHEQSSMHIRWPAAAEGGGRGCAPSTCTDGCTEESCCSRAAGSVATAVVPLADW
jgi:hypothetical protein